MKKIKPVILVVSLYCLTTGLVSGINKIDYNHDIAVASDKYASLYHDKIEYGNVRLDDTIDYTKVDVNKIKFKKIKNINFKRDNTLTLKHIGIIEGIDIDTNEKVKYKMVGEYIKSLSEKNEIIKNNESFVRETPKNDVILLVLDQNDRVIRDENLGNVNSFQSLTESYRYNMVKDKQNRMRELVNAEKRIVIRKDKINKEIKSLEDKYGTCNLVERVEDEFFEGDLAECKTDKNKKLNIDFQKYLFENNN